MIKPVLRVEELKLSTWPSEAPFHRTVAGPDRNNLIQVAYRKQEISLGGNVDRVGVGPVLNVSKDSSFAVCPSPEHLIRTQCLVGYLGEIERIK